MTMSNLSRDIIIFSGLAFLCYSVFYQKKDARDLLVTVITVVLYMGLLTFLLAVVKRLWNSVKPASKSEKEIDEDCLDEDRYNTTSKIQQNYHNQAKSYKERILKPRAEAKRRKAEEDFLRFMGPAWKGDGKELGTPDDQVHVPKPKVKGGSAQDAATARTLPMAVTRTPEPPPKPKTKKVLEIPAEPPEGSVGAVTVVLRTPYGPSHRRKFFITDSVQGVLNYMSSLGFHMKFYTLSTAYPRCDLGEYCDETLSNVGINTDTILNVEEREDQGNFQENRD